MILRPPNSAKRNSLYGVYLSDRYEFSSLQIWPVIAAPRARPTRLSRTLFDPPKLNAKISTIQCNLVGGGEEEEEERIVPDGIVMIGIMPHYHTSAVYYSN